MSEGGFFMEFEGGHIHMEIDDNNVVIENNETEQNSVVEYTDFNRVNFDDPTTILRYGSDLIKEMGALMQDVATMMRRDDVNLSELESKIDKLTTFNDELDELDKKKQQQLVPANGIVKAVSKVAAIFKGKLGIEDESASYADQFDKYTENIDLLGAYVEEQKNNTIADINMYGEFIKQMKPYEADIEKLISVGEQDLADYQAKVSEQEKVAIANGDVDAIREVTLSKQKIEIFQRQLDELRKNLVLIKNTIAECKMTQNTSMEQVFQYDSYVNTALPMMKVQATSMIGVRRQAAALASHKQLVDATNDAIRKNSQLLVGNIQMATDLSVEGNIKMDTLKELDANLKKGAQILKDGYALKKQTIEKNKKAYFELSKSLDDTTNATMGAFAPEVMDVSEVFESHNYPSVSELKPKQKRFRMLPNRKKGN